MNFHNFHRRCQGEKSIKGAKIDFPEILKAAKTISSFSLTLTRSAVSPTKSGKYYFIREYNCHVFPRRYEVGKTLTGPECPIGSPTSIIRVRKTSFGSNTRGRPLLWWVGSNVGHTAQKGFSEQQNRIEGHTNLPTGKKKIERAAILQKKGDNKGHPKYFGRIRRDSNIYFLSYSESRRGGK